MMFVLGLGDLLGQNKLTAKSSFKIVAVRLF